MDPTLTPYPYVFTKFNKSTGIIKNNKKKFVLVNP